MEALYAKLYAQLDERRERICRLETLLKWALETGRLSLAEDFGGNETAESLALDLRTIELLEKAGPGDYGTQYSQAREQAKAEAREKAVNQ